MKFESQLAESVFRSKYLLENEKEPDEAVERIVKSVATIYPEIEEEAREYINKQWFIPAGGVWRAAGNPNKNVSYINCTTLTPTEDNLESIFDSLYKWAKYASFGQGIGCDISKLRPRGAKVHNSSRSSTGAVSFMALYDAVLKVIAQQGRRGASLISMKDTHPDILEFIKVKDKPESDKSRIDTANISVQVSDEFMKAVEQNSDWNLFYENKYERIETIVKARDIFDEICKMAYKRGDPGLQFTDTWREYSNSDPLGYEVTSTNACQPKGAKVLTPEGIKEFKDIDVGSTIWSKDGWTPVINKWSSGVKPVYKYTTYSNAIFVGTDNHRVVQYGEKIEVKDANYIDTFVISEYTDLTTYVTNPSKIIEKVLVGEEEVFEIMVNNESHTYWTDGCNVSNCGEQVLDPENVCNLSHVNLAKYYEYGSEGFKKLVSFGIKFLNAVRLNEINEGRSPTPLQKEKIVKLPRSGLGVTGLADYFLDLDIVYGSEESLAETKKIFSLLAKYSYETGYILAKKYGSFPTYDKENFKKSGFIKNLLDEGIIEDSTLDYQFNVAYNTIAPVGSGSLISNVGGSGIEPLFSRYMVRRERSTTSDWKEWFTFNPYVERYLKEKGISVTKENADLLVDPKWVMSFSVPVIDKIKLVSEVQKYIDSSVSITFNLPEDCLVSDVEETYIEAWKYGLKGVTVYREGSLAGVMITEKNYNKGLKEKEKTSNRDDSYTKRPNSLPCDIYETSYKGEKFITLVGIKDNSPYEVFVSPNPDGNIDVSKHTKGLIIKKSSGHYDLVVENGVVKTMVNNIGSVFDSMYGTLSRMVSMSLRHNVPLQFIVDQLNKDSNIVGFEKTLSRVLKKYISDNTKSKKKCPECGGDLVYQDGCVSCPSCGMSKCD